MDGQVSAGENLANCCKFHWRGILTLLFPVMFLSIFALGTSNEYRCLFLICVMAFYWITEVIPLYVTSMMPIIFLPIMGILDSESTCKQYLKEPLVMFLGGLIVALAIEYCNLHKRLALRVIMMVGCSPRRLHFGLMLVSMLISMWISNSATTAMMCPIIRAVLEELHTQKVMNIYMDTDDPEEEKTPSYMAMAYYLGIAYAATIGGCGTLIGTATNLTFKGIYEGRFPNSTEKIDFPIFMAYCVPLIFIDTICALFCLQITYMGLFRPNSKESAEVEASKTAQGVVENIIKQRYAELGDLTMHELQVIVLFLIMVTLLFTRKPGFVTGWADIINEVPIKNSAPIIMIVIILFLFPMKYSFFQFCCGSGPFPVKEIPSLLSWKCCHDNIPWGLLFLLGGGYALAEGSKESGMAKMLGESMSAMGSMPDIGVQFCSIFIAIFLTTFSSNVAICNVIIPILAELAVAIKIHPLYLIFPAGLACSFAFHLPVSTPPNAIISGYAKIKTKYMAASGIGPSISTIILLLINGQTWHYVIYPTSDTFPDWAV